MARWAVQDLAENLGLVALAVVMLFALPACKKPEYPSCKKDKHCRVDEGESCVDGLCQNCTVDEDCAGRGPEGQNHVCREFRCVDPAEVESMGGSGVGSPCAGSSDCESGLVCTTGACAPCTADVACAPGTCDPSTGRCSVSGVGSCASDDECAMDEICDGDVCVFSGVVEGAQGNPCDLAAVYFAFDSPTIEADAAAALQRAAECVNQQGRMVYLEAHADRRGTEEYNIMLTQRRGESVRAFLADLGVSPDDLQVIAKGNLEATGASEAEMKQDRRVEFIWP